MRRYFATGLVLLLMAWATGCDSRTGEVTAGGQADRFEQCDEADDVLGCQRAFLAERGVEACWKGRSVEARCVVLGMTLQEDEEACQETFGELRDFVRAIPTCQEIHGEEPSDLQAFDELYVGVMAGWVEFELNDHGELDVALRYLRLRPGFAQAIVNEQNEANQRYLMARDSVREILSAERLSQGE